MGVDQIKLNSSASNYDDSFPIGNSHLGALISGDVNREEITLNDSTFYTTKGLTSLLTNYNKNRLKVAELLDNNKYQEAFSLSNNLLPKKVKDTYYMQAGILSLDFGEQEVSNYSRSLLLSEGYAKVEYDINKNHIVRTYIASNVYDLIGINIKSSSPISVVVSLDSLQDYKHTKIHNNMQSLHVKNSNNNLYSNIFIKSGKIEIKDNKFILSGMNIVIYYSSSTNKHKKLPHLYLRNLFQSVVLNLKFNQFFKESVEAYKKFYNRQSFHTNLDILDNYYNLSRYLLISSSLGKMPITDTSLWTNEQNELTIPYKIDFNFNLIYYFSLESNLKETMKTALDFTKKLYKNGKKTAVLLYHMLGSVAHSCTDYNLSTSINGYELEDAIWPLSLVRLSSLIYKYYFYTLDIKFLRRNYKVLEGNAKFLKNILVKDKQGKYVLPNSVNPRMKYNVNNEGKDINLSITNGTSYDDIVIYEFLFNYIIVSRILEKPEDLNKDYLDILFNLHHVQIQDNKVLLYHDDLKPLDLSKSVMTELTQITSRHVRTANVFKTASLNTIKDTLAFDGEALRYAYAVNLYVHLGEANLAYNTLLEFNKYNNSQSFLTKDSIRMDALMCLSKGIRDMFIIDSDNKIILENGLCNECNTYTLKGFPIYNNMSIDLYKTHDMFLLYIESLKKEDIEIIYKSRQYFVHIHQGKTCIDLLELTKVKSTKKIN